MRLREIFGPLLALFLLAVTPAFAVPQGDGVSETEVWLQYEEKLEEAQSKMVGAPNEAHDLALDIRKSLALLRPSEKVSSARATIGWIQAESLVRMNKPDEAKNVLDETFPLIDEATKSTKLYGDLLLTRGRVAQSLGNVSLALESYLDAHDVFTVVNVPRSRKIALIKVGDIYNEAEHFEKAIAYYEDASESQVEDPTLTMVVNNNLGNALRGSGDYKASIERFEEALKVAQGFESPMLNARILTNIASARLLAGQLDLAQETAELGLAQVAELNETGWKPFLLGVKAQVAYRREHYRTADFLIGQTFAGQDLTKTPMPFRDFHEVAYKIYAARGVMEKALQHLEAFKRLEDEAMGGAASANSALMTAQFDFASQELRIEQLRTEQLEADIKLAEARVRQRAIVFGGASVVVVLILVFLTAGFLSVRRSRDQIRAANEKLLETNTALEKANNAKSKFLATTSHEIRTPLNGILGMTQVVLSNPLIDSETKKRLEVVRSAGHSMKAIVDDLLDVAKIETGEVTIHKTNAPILTLFEDVTRLWEATATDKGLSFKVDLSECPQEAIIDEKKVRQITFNLLSNAVKFTLSGEVSVAATLVGEGEEQRVRFTVHDTGIGIPEDEQDNIFNAFHQVDGARTRQFEGTGLGLSICRQLSRALGGEVSVESRIDEGSTFTFEFPLEVTKLQADTCASRPLPSNAAEVQVLVIEPNMLEQFVVQAELGPQFARVEVVGAIDEAVECLKLHAFDVVVIPQSLITEIEGLSANLERTVQFIATADEQHDGYIPTISNPISAEALANCLAVQLSWADVGLDSKESINAA